MPAQSLSKQTYAAPMSSCLTECTANPVRSSFRLSFCVRRSTSSWSLSVSAAAAPEGSEEAGKGSVVDDEAEGADLSCCWSDLECATSAFNSVRRVETARGSEREGSTPTSRVWAS